MLPVGIHLTRPSIEKSIIVPQRRALSAAATAAVSLGEERVIRLGVTKHWWRDPNKPVIDELEDDTKARNVVTKPLHAGTMLYGKKCTRLDYEGNGVVPVYSRVCKHLYTPKHPRVLPGDTVDLSIERKVEFWDRKTSPRYSLAVQTGVKPSELRVAEVPCKHFAEGCGGCRILPLKYEEQVKRKVRFLSQLCPTQPLEFHKSTSELGFRTLSVDTIFNEAKTTPGAVAPEVQFGLAKFDTEEHMSIDECPLLTPLAARVRRIAMSKIRGALLDTKGPRHHRLSAFSPRNGLGLLRALWVRVDDSDKQAIVGLEVSPGYSKQSLKRLRLLAGEIMKECGDATVGVVKIERYQYDGVEEENEDQQQQQQPRIYEGDVSLVGDGSLPIHIEGFDHPYMIEASGYYPNHNGLSSVLLNTVLKECETDDLIVDLYASRTHGLYTGLLVAIGNPKVNCVLDSTVEEGNHTIVSSIGEEDAQFTEVADLVTEDGINGLRIEDEIQTLLLTPPAGEGISEFVRNWIEQVQPERLVYHNTSFRSATADIRALTHSREDGLSYKVVKLVGFDTTPHTMECSLVVVLQRDFDAAKARESEEKRRLSNDSSRDYMGIDEANEDIDICSDDEFDVDKLVAQYSGTGVSGKDGIYTHEGEEEEEKVEEWKFPEKDQDVAPPIKREEQRLPPVEEGVPRPRGIDEESDGTVQKRWKHGEQKEKEGDPSVHRRNKNKRWSH
ncbi:hypothetical protein FOL47_009150 [Perkinsus chesapeaki]|uniref:tRNA methyltransferase 2 n=1 Tax=Perkinsus chesapeaki TaxID=330153 RepID=A0A7J6MT19_PERCH|nr:hypothetical protein FOL47_009150 [Perkinsus chesapeaki]